MIKLNFVLCLSLLCGFAFSIPGGPREITDETELLELRNNLTKHLRKLGAPANGTELGFVKLHTATIQVVAGSLYKMMAELNENNKNVNCTVSLWEKPWENFIKFDVECGDDEKRLYQWRSDAAEATTEIPAGFGGFGGLSPLSEKALLELHPKISESFTKLGKKHEGFDWFVKRLLSGKSQVVAGTRYVVTVEAANPSDEVKTCEADIWEKSWENFFQVKLTCQEENFEVQL